MPNLTSTIFTLTAVEDITLPVNNGGILQGAFLNWLQQDAPELAVKLHDKYQRFYTVSGLNGEFARERAWLKIAAGQTAWFRVTIMNEEIADALLSITGKGNPGPQLDDSKWQPDEIFTEQNSHEFTRLTSFAELAEATQSEAENRKLPSEVILRFVSPTCFMENEQSLPLPVPNYVFGYLFNLWQNTSPFPLPVEDVGHFVENIHLAYTTIKTQPVDFKKFRRTGFVGLCRFGLHPKMPDLYRMLLHVLAKFAFFSGVGSHTNMGMGQVFQEFRKGK